MTGPRDAAHRREVVGRTTIDSIMRSGGGACRHEETGADVVDVDGKSNLGVGVWHSVRYLVRALRGTIHAIYVLLLHMYFFRRISDSQFTSWIHDFRD